MKRTVFARFSASAALLLGLSVALPAAADERAITLNYDIELAGASGVRVDTVTRLSNDRYAVDAQARKYGLLSTFTGAFNTRISSRGSFAANQLTIAGSQGHLKTSEEDRRFTYVYSPDGKLSYRSEPAIEIKPGREVSDEQRRGAYDPLTAAILALLTRADPCEGGPLPVFDGRRRFDLMVERRGLEKVPDGKALGVSGDGLRCDVRMRRIAGYKRGADSDTEFTKPARLWLAKLDDSGRYYPVRLEIDIGIGAVIARVVKFEQRPLNDEDKQALAK